MRRALLALFLVALSGCGLTPIYAGGTDGATARRMAEVDVAPIADRTGQLVHRSILEHIPPGGTPTYRLEVALDDDILGFGIRGDDSIARERVELTARFRLIDLTTGDVVWSGVSRSDSGVDVVDSDYAVIAAEQTARERNAEQVANDIAARLALFLRAD